MRFNLFDLVAGIYDRAAPYVLTQTDRERFHLPTAGCLLDAGGGTGRLALALGEDVKLAVVVDSSWGMVRRASSKGLLATHAVLEGLPFAEQSFDRIVMMDAFHHDLDHDKTIAELWRILVPGGWLVIIEPDKRHLRVKLIALMEKLLLMRSHFFDSEDIVGLLQQPDSRIDALQDGFSIWILAQKVRQM